MDMRLEQKEKMITFTCSFSIFMNKIETRKRMGTIFFRYKPYNKKMVIIY